MAKSRTRKKLNKNSIPQLELIASAATEYIKQWTVREFNALHLRKDASICVPTANGYRIGAFKLTVNKNKTCTVLNPNMDLDYTFDNKINAVLYAIYVIKKQYKTADKIFGLDVTINRNFMDILNFKRTMETAKKNKDYISYDIVSARLNNAELSLRTAKEQMARLHLSAKIHKVWE